MFIFMCFFESACEDGLLVFSPFRLYGKRVIIKECSFIDICIRHVQFPPLFLSFFFFYCSRIRLLCFPRSQHRPYTLTAAMIALFTGVHSHIHFPR